MEQNNNLKHLIKDKINIFIAKSLKILNITSNIDTNNNTVLLLGDYVEK